MAISHIELSDVSRGHPVMAYETHWQLLRGDRKTPRWADFDPVGCTAILPWLLLLKPDRDGRLYYAVSGTGCDRLFDFTYQGKQFGEGLPKDAFEDRVREFREIVEAQAPRYSRVFLPVKDHEFIEVYRGVFPFLDDDNDVEAIVVVIAPINTFVS